MSLRGSGRRGQEALGRPPKQSGLMRRVYAVDLTIGRPRASNQFTSDKSKADARRAQTAALGKLFDFVSNSRLAPRKREQDMTSKAQMSGMRGVYLVASELARLGLITSPTSRSARGADILATTAECDRAFSVEVKTTTTNNFWQLAKHAKTIAARSHVYVFVRVKRSKGGIDTITYYPVSSKLVCKYARLPDPKKRANAQYRTGYSIDAKDIARFESRWGIFGVWGSGLHAAS